MGRYWLSLMLGAMAGVLVAVGAALVLVAPMVVAHRSNLPLEKVYGDFAVGLASRVNAGNAQSPLAQNQRSVQAGRLAYIGSCAQCHGAAGDGKGIFGTATYPPASDLTAGDAREKTDAQLFWIVKNGLSFTGMPAFGGQYSDQDIWSLVAYLRSLQKPAASPAPALAIPSATTEQLAVADSAGTAVQRGAAVYFAQGCAECHGAIGNAAGELRLRSGERELIEAIRSGRRGMPSYSTATLSDQDLAELQAYVNTFAGGPGPGPGAGGAR
jgi:mono/diheme cytochrome c family protein